MIKVRKGVFETNSSSTHSICITKDKPLVIPPKVTFVEFDDYSTIIRGCNEKYSVLITSGVQFSDILDEEGVEYDLNDFSKEFDVNTDVRDYEELFNGFDKDKIKRFLFSPYSFIITDEGYRRYLSYPHEQQSIFM